MDHSLSLGGAASIAESGQGDKHIVVNHAPRWHHVREVLESALGEQADLLKQNVGQFLATIRQTGS